MCIYIWDYGGHQLRLKCAQVHHLSPAGIYVDTGPGEVSSLITDPPGTPVIPCFNKICLLPATLYVCSDVAHTHPALGRVKS